MLPLFMFLVYSFMLMLVISDSLLDQMFVNIVEDIKKASNEILFSIMCNTFSVKALEYKHKNIVLKRIDLLENAALYGYVNLKAMAKCISNTETRFVESHKTFQQISLVDGKKISFLNPDENSQSFGQTIHNEHLGTKYKIKFFDLYNDAIPARVILGEMENQKNIMLCQALIELNDAEIVFLKHIIDYGIFLSHSDGEKEYLIQNQRLKKFIKKSQ